MALLQRLPVRQQLPLVKLCPSQYEALLTPGKGARQSFDSLNIVNSYVVLIIRVKVRHMMLSSGLDEHTNYNSKEPRNLRHFLLT